VLGDMPNLDSILPAIVRLLTETLRVPYAAIYLRRVDGDEDVLAAEWATDESLVPALALDWPIEQRDETIGRLSIGYFDGAQRPNDSALRVIQDFLRRAAPAVWAVRLMHDLRRAREQLVFAREEERRLLRRNLHDTIGPTLAALNLRSNALRKLIESDPPTAAQQMGELREQIRSVITDIRRVVYNLRPPALDELGLVSAIREQACQFSVDLFQVFVDAPDSMPPINAASEVAAYRIVSEGLANVVRHANARKCWIKLAHDDVALRVEILDDGIGMSMDGPMGVGLQSMRQRARELGGRCSFQSAPGQGMLVRASLPFSTGTLPPDEMIDIIGDLPVRDS
jgi:signal transduction histidine kinase